MPPFAVRKTAYCDVRHGISGCKRGHIGKMRSVVWINNNMTRTGINDDNVIKI